MMSIRNECEVNTSLKMIDGFVVFITLLLNIRQKTIH